MVLSVARELQHFLFLLASVFHLLKIIHVLSLFLNWIICFAGTEYMEFVSAGYWSFICCVACKNLHLFVLLYQSFPLQCGSFLAGCNSICLIDLIVL